MRRHFHPLQKIDGRIVEGGGKAVQTQALGLLFQLRLPFPWRIGLGIQIVKISAFPKSSLPHHEFGTATVDRNGISSISLEFDCISAGFFGGAYDLRSFLKGLPMVGRQLGNDVAGLTHADVPAQYLYFSGHYEVRCNKYCSAGWPLTVVPAFWRNPALSKARTEALFSGLIKARIRATRDKANIRSQADLIILFA